MNFLFVFFVLSLINVVFSTIRTITTIKSGQLIASLISAGYFAFYNIMLVYTVADFPMWQKCTITFICNFVGVYVVKVAEKKMQKSKLWKIEVTLPTEYAEKIDKLSASIPHSYLRISDKHTLFNFYCETHADSTKIRKLVDHFGARYFATESKVLY